MALLKGLPEPVLQECYDQRVKLMPGAKELLTAAMRGQGAYCRAGLRRVHLLHLARGA